MTLERLSRREFLRGRARPAPVVALATRESAEAAPMQGSVARIELARCLTSLSQICTVCVERCGAHAAIRLEGMAPRVVEPMCTGCGACASACPAPVPAIRMARSERAG